MTILSQEEISKYQNMKEEELQSLSEEEFLVAYKNVKKKTYEKASNTVDMVIFTVDEEEPENKRKKPTKKLQTLLVERGGHPYKGSWALAGGFVNMDEDLDTAVKRELQEETSLDNVYAEQLYTWSEVERDPRMRVISSSYMALLPKASMESAKAGDDAVNVGWFDVEVEEVQNEAKLLTETSMEQIIVKELTLVNEEFEKELKAVVKTTIKTVGTITETKMEILESDSIAFDHAKIILTALERLQGKLEYTNVAFNLMETKFTLTDLQNVYEAILGKSINKKTFRKRISSMVVELDEFEEDVWYSPSKLYKYNLMWKKSDF